MAAIGGCPSRVLSFVAPPLVAKRRERAIIRGGPRKTRLESGNTGVMLTGNSSLCAPRTYREEFMRFPTLHALAAGAVLAAFAAMAGPAEALNLPFAVACNTGGDQLGYSVATNGDYNGDGVRDIAIGSPCYHAGKFKHAGRVIVISGANGRKLLSKKGAQTAEWLGTAVEFVGDLNKDGRDELAVGSPGYDVSLVEDPTGPVGGRNAAGKVEVFQRRRRKNKLRLKILGLNQNAGFGEQIAQLSDVDGDKRADFAVAASRDKNSSGGSRPGRVYIISGKKGEILGFKEGPRAGKRWGQVLTSAEEDVDGDGIVDFLAGSREVNLNSVKNAGVVDTVSPVDLENEINRVVGARGDGIGRAIDAAGDVDGDGVSEFITGSYRSDDSDGLKRAGMVRLISFDGRLLWAVPDEQIQADANFGVQVAKIGDVDLDGVTDFAASAYQQDLSDGKEFFRDVGRVVMLSGVDGRQIWAVNGRRQNGFFVRSLTGDLDWNEDESPDVVVGSTGTAPFGRRGAGSVTILSGRDGSELFSVAGRRGLETRIVVAAPTRATQAEVRSFNIKGRPVELSSRIMRNDAFGDLSLAVLDDRNQPEPKQVDVAVGTGSGSSSSRVEVFKLGSPSLMVDSFEAFPEPELVTGVNLGAGQLDGELNENLACAQADSVDGNVLMRIYRRFQEEEPFFLASEFQVFNADDNYNDFFKVNARGATVAVGDVTGGAAEEIIVAPSAGEPLIKIFSRTGQFIRSFPAYDPVIFSGVDIAVADLDGGGELEILTVPRNGQALVKAFNGNGDRVTFGRDGIEISIMAMDPSYTGGARIAAADIDLDERDEIIVVIPGPPAQRRILAFERDGTTVKGFREPKPFKDSNFPGVAVVGTNLFVRN